MALSAKAITERVETLRARNQHRDEIMDDVLAIRQGKWEEVYPGLFPPKFPKPMVANLIDTVASDLAQEVAPLPSFNCKTPSMASDRQRKLADKRTKIANLYVDSSNLQTQMFAGVDRLLSYGYVAFMSEPDYDMKIPKILVDNNHRTYYQNDPFNAKTLYYVRVWRQYVDHLKLQFPEAAPALEEKYPGWNNAQTSIMVYRWWDADQQALVTEDGILLSRIDNPVPGKCPVRVVEMPKLGESPRGQYDDVVWVQGARALAQVYLLQGMDETVNAPIAVPDDVQELEYGPGSVMRSETPEKIGRIDLNIPNGLFAELQNMTQELRLGARYPEGRSGNIDASIITGQGVEALQGTFTAQKFTAQLMLVQGLRDIIAMCFEMDEKLWPNTKKSGEYNNSGETHEVTYTPAIDIKNNYTCDVSYGLVGGLDPNRALVWLLQAQTAGAISLDTLRRELPVDLNVGEEETKINTELIRSSALSAIAGLAQAIPALATGGMDPSMTVQQIAEFVRLTQKGDSPEEALSKVFQPPPPPEPAPAPEEEMAPEGGGAGPEGGAPVPGTDLGTGGGQANDLLMTLAGLTPGGNANLQSTVSRRTPIPG